MEVTPQTIWSFAQNRPSLVADDLEVLGISREVTHSILLKRGIYKWLAVRRELIKLKNKWRDELTELYHEAGQYTRGSPERREIVGRIKTLEKCRAEVRELCHSDRWQAPDFDKEANDYIGKGRECNPTKNS